MKKLLVFFMGVSCLLGNGFVDAAARRPTGDDSGWGDGDDDEMDETATAAARTGALPALSGARSGATSQSTAAPGGRSRATGAPIPMGRSSAVRSAARATVAADDADDDSAIGVGRSAPRITVAVGPKKKPTGSGVAAPSSRSGGMGMSAAAAPAPRSTAASKKKKPTKKPTAAGTSASAVGGRSSGEGVASVPAVASTTGAVLTPRPDSARSHASSSSSDSTSPEVHFFDDYTDELESGLDVAALPHLEDALLYNYLDRRYGTTENMELRYLEFASVRTRLYFAVDITREERGELAKSDMTGIAITHADGTVSFYVYRTSPLAVSSHSIILRLSSHRILGMEAVDISTSMEPALAIERRLFLTVILLLPQELQNVMYR